MFNCADVDTLVSKAKTEVLKWLCSLGQHILSSSSDVIQLISSRLIIVFILLLLLLLSYYFLLYRCLDDDLKMCVSAFLSYFT